MHHALESFHRAVTFAGGIVWGPPFLVLLIGTGLFLTVYLRAVQVRQFRHGFDVIRGKYDRPDEKGDLSHFEALSAALSATIGIGNIAGVATAIHYGGPGAIFWMWVVAFVGMATKGVECFLGHRFRVVHGDGTVSGGPMYYIVGGMGPRWRWLAVTFAFVAAVASLGSADMVQSNTVSQILHRDLALPAWATGLTLALLVGVVIIGGIRRIGHVAARLVPAMCVVYMAGGVAILLAHASAVPQALRAIVTCAFSPQAEVGGFAGATMVAALTWGAKRGLFSNEAGQGSAPIAHATAKTSESVREGIVAGMGPFIDTIVVCTVTALIIVVTGAWTDALDASGQPLNGAALTAWAFDRGLSSLFPGGRFIITLAVPLFAYTTMIGWAYYGDRSVSFLWGARAVRAYRVLFVLCAFVGSTLALPLVWDMADVSNGMMAVPNLVALIALARFARREYDAYEARMARPTPPPPRA